MKLLDRNYRLALVREGETTRIAGNRIRFEVQKFAGLNNNIARVIVYNMNERDRILFSRPISFDDILAPPIDTLFLGAGYGAAPPLIMRGVVRQALMSRAGVDWLSEFEAYTALEQFSRARLNKDYDRVFAQSLVEELFDVLKWGRPRLSLEAARALSGQILVGYSVAGSAATSLMTLLAKFRLTFTIDDDGPVVVKSGSSIDTDEPDDALPLISVKTGMVGAPKIIKQGIVVRSLLNEKIRPFKSFVVEAETITGTLNVFRQRYTAVKVRHFGDTRDDDWFTEVIGIYPNLVPADITIGFDSPVPLVQ